MKRRLAAIWLVLFAVWPLVHYGLTRAYELAPSRFGGWARFAAPELEPNVVLFRIELRGAQTVDDIQAAKIGSQHWSDDLRAAHKRYATERALFGRLMPPPERLGARLLDEQGETGMVLVVVQTRRLNRDTGLIEANLEKYVYSDREKVRSEIEGGSPD